MANEIKHMIWSGDVFDYLDGIKEQVEMEGEEWTFDEMVDYAWREIELDYDAELANLNKPLPRQIVAFADLGLWNGRCPGYRILGDNLNDIIKIEFYGDMPVVYTDDNDIHCKDTHHDGTNYYTYRLLNEDVDDGDLYWAMMNNQLDWEFIEANSTSLFPYVAKVYGWD